MKSQLKVFRQTKQYEAVRIAEEVQTLRECATVLRCVRTLPFLMWSISVPLGLMLE